MTAVIRLVRRSGRGPRRYPETRGRSRRDKHFFDTLCTDLSVCFVWIDRL